MRTSSWIARRYFFSRSKTRFLPFLTAIAIGGVALGTCAMVVILSVMNGFREELETRLLGFNAHITVTRKGASDEVTSEKLRSFIGPRRVVDLMPFVEGEVIVEARVGDELFAQGARLRGLNPNAMGFMSKVKHYFPDPVSPAEALSRKYGQKNLSGIILGKDILGQLNIHPDFYDEVEAIAPLADVGPTGEMEPRLMRFLLAGYFISGVYEYDNHYAVVGIDEARKLLGAQSVEGWQIRIADPHRAPQLVVSLEKQFGREVKVEGWHQRNKKLFAALKLERVAMGGVLTLVILIASFSVIGVIMMVVSSKRKDVALLKSMGMCSRSVGEIFLRQGMWIGVIGSGIGCLIGLAVCGMLLMWPISLPQSYYIDVLEVNVEPWWVIAIAALGVLLAMASSIYPVSRMTAEEPAMVLRYE